LTPKTSIRWAALGVSVLAMCACEMFEPEPPSPRQVEADAGDVVDDREIVVLARTSAAAFSLTQKSALRGYSVEYREDLTGLGLVLLVMIVPANMPGAAAIRELESLEPGVSAGVNHAYRIYASGGSGGNRREYADQLLGWPAEGCRADTAIGMIDAAVDSRDPGLAGASILARDFTRAESDTTNAHPVRTDHGTVTAEILAGDARLAGVRLQAASVIADHRSANQAAGVDSIVRAIDWMQTSGVRLVNFSLAGPYNKILDRSLHSAIESGMIIVAAAGNTGPNSPARYPAAFDGVIAVTAIDVESKVYDNAVQGEQIDFAAPGVDVFVPVGSGGRYVTGTSVAAPFVTARIAADPLALSAKTAGAAMKSLAASSTDLGAPGRDAVYGFGLPRLNDGCRRR
jgi:hypothetical protein